MLARHAVRQSTAQCSLDELPFRSAYDWRDSLFSSSSEACATVSGVGRCQESLHSAPTPPSPPPPPPDRSIHPYSLQMAASIEDEKKRRLEQLNARKVSICYCSACGKQLKYRSFTAHPCYKAAAAQFGRTSAKQHVWRMNEAPSSIGCAWFSVV